MQVLKIKKEINWDVEEQKHQEMVNRVTVAESSSSDEEVQRTRIPVLAPLSTEQEPESDFFCTEEPRVLTENDLVLTVNDSTLTEPESDFAATLDDEEPCSPINCQPKSLGKRQTSCQACSAKRRKLNIY